AYSCSSPRMARDDGKVELAAGPVKRRPPLQRGDEPKEAFRPETGRPPDLRMVQWLSRWQLDREPLARPGVSQSREPIESASRGSGSPSNENRDRQRRFCGPRGVAPGGDVFA